MKKNIFAIALLAILFAGAIVMVACNKENKEDVKVSESTAKRGDAVVLGYFSARTNSIQCNFNIEEYIDMIENRIVEEFGKEISIEKIKIVDDEPLNMEYYAFMQITYYDVERAITITSAYELDKYIDGDGDVLYFATGRRKESISCISDGCKQGECIYLRDRYGVPYDCTNCKKGCKKVLTSTIEEPGLYDILRLIIDGITAVGPFVKI